MAVKSMLLAAAFASVALAHSAIPLVVNPDDKTSQTSLGFIMGTPLKDTNKNVIEVTAVTHPGNRANNLDGWGTLNQKKAITLDMLPAATTNAKSAGILTGKPGGTLDITYRQLVVDGRCEPEKGCKVYIDETATGKWSTAKVATLATAPKVYKTQLLPGNGQVVGEESPMVVQLPADLKCTGPDNTCGWSVSNSKTEGNQYWGGVGVFQQTDGTTTTAAPATAQANTKGANKVGRAVAVRSIVKRSKPIMVRDGGVERLAKELAKRAVPNDTSDDKVGKRTNPDDLVYPQDLEAFEAQWEAEHAVKADPNNKKHKRK